MNRRTLLVVGGLVTVSLTVGFWAIARRRNTICEARWKRSWNDDRARAREGISHMEIAAIATHVEEIVLVVIQAVRDQSIEHAPLVIFALAAAVLVLFMLRT